MPLRSSPWATGDYGACPAVSATAGYMVATWSWVAQGDRKGPRSYRECYGGIGGMRHGFGWLRATVKVPAPHPPNPRPYNERAPVLSS